MAPKLVILTAYDYPSAFIAASAGVDIILVGDSAANVVHGMKSTTEIGMTEMLVHTRAVSRGIEKFSSSQNHPASNANNPPANAPKARKAPLIVGDMPAHSYDTPRLALQNSKKFLEAGAQGVKIEGEKTGVVEILVGNGIKVMGHLGYLPQTDPKPKVKGREETEAQQLISAAKNLEKAGCSWLVLELVPEQIAKEISETIKIPTIGIGAGRYCAGQVLVFHDLLGLNPDDSFKPRFLRKYADLKKEAIGAIRKYSTEVRDGRFPGVENIY